MSYWLLLFSTIARFGAEITRVTVDTMPLKIIVLTAGVGQVVGLGVYFFTMWTRIRPVGSHIREAKGERF